MAKSKSKGNAKGKGKAPKGNAPSWASKKKSIESIASRIGKLQKELGVLAAKLEAVGATDPGGGGNPKT